MFIFFTVSDRIIRTYICTYKTLNRLTVAVQACHILKCPKVAIRAWRNLPDYSQDCGVQKQNTV